MKLNRRNFILASSATALTGCISTSSSSSTSSSTSTSLLASAPVLQNAAETSIGVSFAVSADASGWVEIGEKPDLSDARKVYSGEHGLMTVDDKVALVRITDLKPATKYYYRIGADRINFEGGYQMHNLGPETDKKINSFTTLGKAAPGSFCVINDTHNRKDALALVLGKLKALKPAAVIWNGDASNTSEKIEQALDIFIHTHPDFPEYAADTPYIFLNGNHDFRGRFNRRLGELMMFREPSERKGEYAELGRNFVQRFGDIALIGLDTGEDKLDTNPVFAGLFKMAPYREKQTKWLSEVIESETVKTAKYKIAFCHIPLFDSDPKANPGDVAPNDEDFSRYTHNFAIWQRTCANLWAPYFEKAGVQLVITAHQHRFRVDRPTANRKWMHVVGGGPELGIDYHWTKEKGDWTTPNPAKFPTVMEGKIEGGKLHLIVHDVFNKKIVFDEFIA